MKMKALTLAIILLLGAVAQTGCTSKEAKTSGEGGTYEVIWHDKGSLTEDHDLVYEEINKYIEPLIGATVKNIPFSYSEYTEKIRLVLASQSDFDICFTASGNNYEINAANDGFLDVEELLKSHGQGILEQVPEYVLEAAKINGVLYAVPCYKDYAQENVFYYNGDIADKHNIDMSNVKTLADLGPIMQTIKEKEPELYPMLFTYSLSPYSMMSFEKVSGGVVGSIDLNGDPTKIINPFETEEAMEYFKTMHSFYKQGFFRPEVATLTNNDDIDDSRRFFAIVQELPYLVDQRNATKSFEDRVLHLQESPLISTSCVRGSMIAFNKNSKNPEKAMEFLNLLNTDKTLRNMVAYGIEGKHYIAVGEDQYKLPEGCTTKEDTGFNTSVFTQGNKYLTRMIEGTPADIFEKYQEFDNNARKSPALGFAFDPTKVKSQYSAVSNAYNQYMPALLTGSVDPEKVLPDAMEKLRAAGLDELLAEMQKQYDEWRALTGK
ncbi:MAG: ABC transporter substrate-binding protein [Clostridia bacterium]|nr:ABC transporter substrate-binding protein [Clostridia bacterium]